MATYKDLQDRINLDYLNQMTLVQETKRAIPTAIRTYEHTRYWFNEASTAVATTSSQSYITVPTDFLFPDRLELTCNGSTANIPRRDFRDIRDMVMNSPAAQPTHFAYHADRIEFASVPDAIYNGTLHYVKALPALSADADTNAWTNEGANLIAHAACIELMSGVLQVNDQRKIERHRLALHAAEIEMASRNDQRLFTRLRSTYF